MNQRALPTLLLACTALAWSSGGLAIKLIDWAPMAITGLRSGLAALVLLAFLGRRAWRPPSRTALIAALAYAAMLASNVAATRLTTAANAILLAYTAPVYVALLAPRLLGEPTRHADWLMVWACLGGMVLFFLDRLGPGGLAGNLLAVGTGLAYAAFTLCLRASRDADPLAAVFLGHCLTFAAGLPFMLASAPPPAEAWPWLLYLGVVQQGLPLLLYVWCIKRLGALQAILVMTLEPILNPLWVALGHGELPGPFAVAGGCVVLAAVTGRALAASRA